jgi:HEAT repeat protein
MPLLRNPSRAAPSVGELADGDLGSPDADLRWAAARAAADKPDSIAELAKALSRETDARVREAICTALARIGSPECAEAVLPLLRSEEASARTAGMDVLRAMPRSLRGSMAALLADPDSDVRLLSCELARELEAPEAEALLISVVETDREANVCAAAIEALSEIGGADALPALARCAARFRDDPFIVFAVEAASERLGAASGR